MFTHFPKDRSCEVCKRTKITRTPCRRRAGEAVPRAEKFGDLFTADHKVLNGGCESRNNHRYSVVVQDFCHSMDSVEPVQNENFSGDGKEFFESFSEKAESHLHWQCHWNWANPVKIYHGIIVLHHLIGPRRMELPKEQCAELTVGTSAVLLQSGLDEKWWAGSMECCC